jgi:hypothetical protein
MLWARKPVNAVDDKVKDLVVELKTKKYGEHSEKS